MHLHGVLETAIYARDLDAAERFYSGVLGLTAFTREPGRHVFFRCGDAVFLVFNPETTAETQTSPDAVAVPAHGAHGPGHVAFRIHAAEIDPWRRRLVDSGISIEAEIDWPHGGHSLYFRDPDGNSIELATPALWGLQERPDPAR